MDVTSPGTSSSNYYDRGAKCVANAFNGQMSSGGVTQTGVLYTVPVGKKMMVASCHVMGLVITAATLNTSDTLFKVFVRRSTFEQGAVAVTLEGLAAGNVAALAGFQGMVLAEGDSIEYSIAAAGTTGLFSWAVGFGGTEFNV